VAGFPDEALRACNLLSLVHDGKSQFERALSAGSCSSFQAQDITKIHADERRITS
jgi:hypothetical protein